MIEKLTFSNMFWNNILQEYSTSTEEKYDQLMTREQSYIKENLQKKIKQRNTQEQ